MALLVLSQVGLVYWKQRAYTYGSLHSIFPLVYFSSVTISYYFFLK